MKVLQQQTPTVRLVVLTSRDAWLAVRGLCAHTETHRLCRWVSVFYYFFN
ncbi:MAG: hypothetical protein LLF96_00325 [Eubacteriales bacterium]|nr:hypothetical protein [Eubacteriales bacterium]